MINVVAAEGFVASIGLARFWSDDETSWSSDTDPVMDLRRRTDNEMTNFN